MNSNFSLEARSEAIKERIIALLEQTQRKGMDKVIEFLQKEGFFQVAASKHHQNNYYGGLAEHSLKVYENAEKDWEARCVENPQFCQAVPLESVIIAGLLHDLCKHNYFPVLLATGEVIPLNDTPHGTKSVNLLDSLGLELTQAERMAIRWHMGRHTKDIVKGETLPSFKQLREEYPLLDMIIEADGKASATPWDADRWLQETMGTGDYRGCRVRVWKNTLGIVEKGRYASQNGKEVTLELNEDIVSESRFYKDEIPQLKAADRYDTIVAVHEGDCLEFAKHLRDEDSADDLCVLNLASFSNPGGGVTHGAGAQEEYLFRCSDYFRSLYQYAEYSEQYGIRRSREQYPLDRDFGGIFSHGVTIFRDKEASGYALLDMPWRVNFIAAAAPRLVQRPTRIPDSVIPMVVNTIRTIFRIAYVNGQRRLVLGALGCGAFNNPPRHMAELFKQTLAEPEFQGIFKEVHFAIFDDHNALRNGESNLKAFEQVFRARP